MELECWIGTLIGWSELELADCLPRKLKWLEQLDASRLGTRIALSKFGVGLVAGWKAKLAVRAGKGFFVFLHFRTLQKCFVLLQRGFLFTLLPPKH